MISKERFQELFDKSKERSAKNKKADKIFTNGTSEGVLAHLRTLSDATVMAQVVANLETEMFETFTIVHGKEMNMGNWKHCFNFSRN
ncbi:MAG: hypothetical protein WCW84_11350 [Sulfurimonas sp.]